MTYAQNTLISGGNFQMLSSFFKEQPKKRKSEDINSDAAFEKVIKDIHTIFNYVIDPTQINTTDSEINIIKPNLDSYSKELGNNFFHKKMDGVKEPISSEESPLATFINWQSMGITNVNLQRVGKKIKKNNQLNINQETNLPKLTVTANVIEFTIWYKKAQEILAAKNTEDQKKLIEEFINKYNKKPYIELEEVTNPPQQDLSFRFSNSPILHPTEIQYTKLMHRFHAARKEEYNLTEQILVQHGKQVASQQQPQEVIPNSPSLNFTPSQFLQSTPVAEGFESPSPSPKKEVPQLSPLEELSLFSDASGTDFGAISSLFDSSQLEELQATFKEWTENPNTNKTI